MQDLGAYFMTEVSPDPIEQGIPVLRQQRSDFAITITESGVDFAAVGKITSTGDAVGADPIVVFCVGKLHDFFGEHKCFING